MTLEELLPYLRPGGVYICEDVHGDDNAFLGYVHGLSRGLFGYDLTLDEADPSGSSSSPATAFQSAIHSVHVYPYVVVIERRDRPLDELVAAKHGTDGRRVARRSSVGAVAIRLAADALEDAAIAAHEANSAFMTRPYASAA